MSNGRQFDDAYDALNQSIAETGRTRKEIAARLYPGRKIETAMSLFTRKMTPENTDVHLTEEDVEAIMEATRPDDYIFHLCDKFGFERPVRKKAALEADIRLTLQTMTRQMTEVMKKMQELEDEKKKA